MTNGLGMLSLHCSPQILENLESASSGAVYLTSGTLKNNNQLIQMDQKAYMHYIPNKPSVRNLITSWKKLTKHSGYNIRHR